MNGGNCNKKGKWDENLDRSDSDLDDESMNEMLAQIGSAKAYSSSTGQKGYVGHSMLTKDKIEHKTLIIWDPKLNWILYPRFCQLYLLTLPIKNLLQWS